MGSALVGVDYNERVDELVKQGRDKSSASRCLCTSQEKRGKFHTKEVRLAACSEAKFFKGNILHNCQTEM